MKKPIRFNPKKHKEHRRKKAINILTHIHDVPVRLSCGANTSDIHFSIGENSYRQTVQMSGPDAAQMLTKSATKLIVEILSKIAIGKDDIQSFAKLHNFPLDPLGWSKEAEEKVRMMMETFKNSFL